MDKTAINEQWQRYFDWCKLNQLKPSHGVNLIDYTKGEKTA